MNKAETIRFLHAEGCSVSEIALAVGYKEWVVNIRIVREREMAAERIPRAFKGWRGYPISDRVMAF